ncbi:MAG: methyltransferase domain-containing protein, partial [Gammaproteobacteria bacterium]
PEAAPEAAPEIPAAARRRPWGSLLAYAGVGAAALTLEVGWTRLHGMLLLRTEYVLALILAVYLGGVGLGSVLARRLGPAWLAWLPSLAAAWVLLGLLALPLLGAWAESARFPSLPAALAGQSLALLLVTGPVTLALGAWFPLLARRLATAPGPRAPGHQVASGTSWGALLYGANALGGALGALLAGFLLVPLLGTPGTVAAAALLLAGCGLTWSRRPGAWAALAVLLLVAWPASRWPPVARLLPVSEAGSRDLMRYEDAVSITHVVERPDGERLLLSDLQRMDASTAPAAVEAQRDQGRLPLLLRPRPRRVLFLGLGTGITASALLPYPAARATAVELSAGAVRAAGRWFAPANGGVLARLRVVRDDARRFLARDPGRWDLVVGDLFHPDLVGRSELLTLQQFQRVRRHLAPGGVFVQWLALNQFDPEGLRVVLRTFRRAFPEGRLYVSGFRLALAGAAGPWPGPARLRAALEALPPAARRRATGGEGLATWLGRYFGSLAGSLDPGPGPVQDAWAPRIEFRLPRLRYRDRPALAAVLDWLLERRPRMEAAARELGLDPDTDEGHAFLRAYAATELALQGWLAELRGRPGEAQRLLRLAYQANPRDRWVGLWLADRMLASLEEAQALGLDREQALRRILRIRPDHPEALKALWRLARERGDAEAARRWRARLARIDPLDRELREAPGGGPWPPGEAGGGAGLGGEPPGTPKGPARPK